MYLFNHFRTFPSEQSPFQRRRRIFLTVAGLAVVLSAPPLAAQEYEYEPDEGFHREEWYDPSDWFDTTPGVDYESDLFDSPFDGDPTDEYDYTDNYDYDYFDGWNNATEWDSDNNVWSNASIPRGTDRYGWHYDWNPVDGTWRSDYGQYSSLYTYDGPNDFGWHYDWNPRQQQWDSDYGWHESNYEFDQQRSNYSQSSQQNQESRADARQRQNQDRRRAQDQMAQTRNQHTVTGEIVAIRRVGASGQNGAQTQRLLADIRLDNGNRAAVDLSQQRSNVREGDRVTLRGRTVRLNGREVLLAQNIRVDGQNQSSDQAMGSAMGQQRESSSRQFDRAGQGRSVEITGNLEQLRETSLDGSRENHTLLRVRLENGRQETIDLGANFAERYGQERLQRLLDRADQGDRIVIRGERQQVNGRNIIRANQFRLEGRPVLQRHGGNESSQSGRWRDLTNVE